MKVGDKYIDYTEMYTITILEIIWDWYYGEEYLIFSDSSIKNKWGMSLRKFNEKIKLSPTSDKEIDRFTKIN
jgi:hypothetical protein